MFENLVRRYMDRLFRFLLCFSFFFLLLLLLESSVGLFCTSLARGCSGSTACKAGFPSCRSTVGSDKLEYGCRRIYAGSPFVFGLGLEDGHVPTLWLLLYGSGMTELQDSIHAGRCKMQSMHPTEAGSEPTMKVIFAEGGRGAVPDRISSGLGSLALPRFPRYLQCVPPWFVGVVRGFQLFHTEPPDCDLSL